MGTEQEKTMMNTLHSGNTDYNNFTTLQIRLNTEPILRNLEMNLRGYEEKMKVNADGQPEIILEKSGEPKANERGIQSIMGRAQTLINPQTVQGNFDETEKGTFLCRVRTDISTELMINMYSYKVKITDFNSIVNLFMNALQCFISRLQDNKERESYASTIRSIESTQSSVRGGGSQIPFMTK